MGKTKKIMQARVLADVKELKHLEWLELRKKGIGGSDAGAICGLNSFSSPFSVYADKKGLTTEKPVSEAMRIGNDLEEYVAYRWCEATGKKVKKCNYVLQHDKHDFIIGDVDRLVVGENAGLECKTVSAWNKTNFEKGDINPAHYAQCVHYMLVTGARKWYIAILVLGVGFYHFEINRNEEEILSLLTIEQDFWHNHIEADKPPIVDGTEATEQTIKEIYSKEDINAVESDLTPYNSNFEKVLDIDNQIKELEQQKSALLQEVKAFMEWSGTGTSDKFKVSYKTNIRTSIDTKRLREEMPDIAERYTNKTETRVFKYSQIKNK